MIRMYGKLVLPALLVYILFLIFTYQYYQYSSNFLDSEVENRLHTLSIGSQIYLESQWKNLPPSESIENYSEELLANLEDRYSVENLSLFDSTFEIISTTNPFSDGDGLMELITNPEEKELLSKSKTVIRPVLKAGRAHFKTVLIPLKLNSKNAVLMVDVDMEYLKGLEKFKLRYGYGLLTSLFLLVGFLIVLWIIIKQLKNSQLEKQNQEKLALMGKMSASIAHEIKNPLGIIKSTAQLIEKKYGKEKDEIFTYIYDEIDRLDKSINNYLTFSKDIVIEPELINLNSQLEGILRDFPEVIYENKDVGEYYYDPFRLTQLIRNLILNAQKYGKAPVTITLNQINKDCLLQVKDNGPGIPSDKLNSIFEAFNTTSKSGTGLGLNICKKIAELHGGEITAENLSSGGACINLVIKGNFNENSMRG